MTDLSGLSTVQGRRFMLRFDLPKQDIGLYTEDQVKDLFMEACCPTDKDGNPRWHAWGQLELGNKNGRWHIQAYVESATVSPLRASTIVRSVRSVTDAEKKTVSVYIGVAKKRREKCIAYVTKERTRVYGPWSNVDREEWPELEEQDGDGQKVEREDLYQAIMEDGMSVRDVLAEPAMSVAAASCMSWVEKLERERQTWQWGSGSGKRAMNVIYIYGSSGTAKTTVAIEYLKESCGGRGFFSVTDYRRDPWDGYAGEKGLLLDELRLPTPVFGVQEMLQMLDGTPYQLSRRYANSWAAFDLVVITSNWSPGGQWESMKRSAPLSCPLTDEDRTAFYRRLSRVLHVNENGGITDETAVYRGDVDRRGKITLENLKHVLDTGPGFRVESLLDLEEYAADLEDGSGVKNEN